MDWVVRYYHHQASVWEVRYKNGSVSPGASDEAAARAKAYSARQHARWHNVATAAARKFKRTNPNYACHIM